MELGIWNFFGPWCSDIGHSIVSPYPKHYLAEVPHDLRMRVLDLCIHRQWHDALDLLHQNGFTQYEWYELVWFHDHAPTNLAPVACAIPSAPLGRSADSLSAQEHVVPPSGALDEQNVDRTSQIVNPDALTPPCRSVLPAPSVLKPSPVKPKRRRRPRSKACRLPHEVQHTLNTMLANGCRYRDIIHSLNTGGYPGFNKANLNAWKRTGFQDWRRTQESEVIK